MGGFFSLDSKFMQVMSRVADLIILNVIYLVTCLPVVTIGAAGTALDTGGLRPGTVREGSLVKGYFRAFRDEFRQATLIWLFLLLFGAVTLGTNLKDHNGPGISSGAWAMAGGVLIIAVATYFGTLTVG